MELMRWNETPVRNLLAIAIWVAAGVFAISVPLIGISLPFWSGYWPAIFASVAFQVVTFGIATGTILTMFLMARPREPGEEDPVDPERLLKHEVAEEVFEAGPDREEEPATV